jgi:oligosaccharide repeat unit polymerase
MKVLCIFVSVVAIFVGKRWTKKWCNLLTIIGTLHAITVSFAALQLFSYYDSNPAVYFMISLGLLSFTFAYVLAFGDRVHQYNQTGWIGDGEISDRYRVRYPVFVVCVCVLVFFTFQRLAGFFKLIASGLNLATIRLYYFNPELAESALGSISFSKNASVTYFYLPCLFLLMIIATISLFHDLIGRKRKFYIFVIYFCIAIYCLTSGGRNLIYTIGFMVLFCYVYFNKQDLMTMVGQMQTERKLSKKNRRKILFFAACIAVWLILVLSSMREESDSTQSFVETLYQYFCGYIPYSSHFYENLQTSDFTYGWMFISCFMKPFTNLAQSILGLNFPEMYSRACLLLEQFSEHVRISPFLRTNGYVSAFYCFYTDFGYASVIIESMIFGACCGASDAKNKFRPDYRSMVFNLFWFYIVLWSGIRWYFLSVHVMLAFYLNFVMFKKKRSTFY